VRLADLQAELRPRSWWEAMELGLALLRRDAAPALGAWLALALPSWLLIAGLLWRHPFWALALLWWLEALWDLAVLHVLSRSLFGSTPSVGATLRAWPGLVKRLLLPVGLRYRLGPSQAARLPVLMLEGLARGRRAARMREMLTGLYAPNLAMSLLTTLMRLNLLLAAAVLAGWFGSQPLPMPGAEIIAPLPSWFQLAAFAALFVSAAVVRPVEVAAGFGLYLTRRTASEGWDIELRFRRLADRLRGGTGAALLVLVILLVPHAATAQDDDPAGVIHQVLQHEDFDTTHTRTRWVPRERAPEATPEPAVPPRAEASDRGRSSRAETRRQPATPLHSLVGTALETVLWAALVLVLALVVWEVIRRGRGAPTGPHAPPGGPRPAVATAGASPHGAPPLDPVNRARQLWHQGQAAAALGALYKAAVLALVAAGLKVPDGATEGEVLRLAQRQLTEPGRSYLQRLVRAWQALAYAHRTPDDASFEAFLSDWPEGFDDRDAP
jgi:hypothetical protein